MHDDALPEAQRAALFALSPATARGFYLAGGTALCLHLGHRRSIDIDLFRVESFDPEELLEDLKRAGVNPKTPATKPDTLWIEVEGVKTSLMRFPYPLVNGTENCSGIEVASLDDIAAMKIEAISSRGARKDFYDLYFICQTTPLDLRAALGAFGRRFASAQPEILHRLKALTYFEDAEQEPEPELLKPASWREVRSFFEAEVRTLFRNDGGHG